MPKIAITMQPHGSPADPSHGLPGRPSRSFLITVSATLFVGALMLTPSVALPSATFRDVASLSAPSAPPDGRKVMVSPQDSADLERQVVARYDHLPLARLLSRHARRPETANRIARAIMREAGRLHLAPSLLTGLLLTENARLDPRSVSSAGAIGLMQVMHFHAGEFNCASNDLVQVESNICHGASVFGGYLKRSGNLRRALLRYNGCVTGSHTPNCHRYPAKVLRAAQQVRRQLILYAPAGAWYRATHLD